MQDDLLWVYEGLTNYLGFVLTARSGLLTADQDRDDLAITAARLDHCPAAPGATCKTPPTPRRNFISLRDAWYSWRRSTDFYDEDTLNWLWVDVIIRQQSKGEKSIDDFCHLFHGAPSTGPALKTYTFDDVVNTLEPNCRPTTGAASGPSASPITAPARRSAASRAADGKSSTTRLLPKC